MDTLSGVLEHLTGLGKVLNELDQLILCPGCSEQNVIDTNNYKEDGLGNLRHISCPFVLNKNEIIHIRCKYCFSVKNALRKKFKRSQLPKTPCKSKRVCLKLTPVRQKKLMGLRKLMYLKNKTSRYAQIQQQKIKSALLECKENMIKLSKMCWMNQNFP